MANKAKNGRYEPVNTSSATSTASTTNAFGSRLGYGQSSDLLVTSSDSSSLAAGGSSKKKLKMSDSADSEMSPEEKVRVET